jgi:hypothetical protein
MFLAGLKFALGMAAGMGIVTILVAGLLGITDWIVAWRKKQGGGMRKATGRMSHSRTPPANVRVVLRFPPWLYESPESFDRSAKHPN